MDIYSYSAIILAAGDGVRLKSSIPKAFHRVGGLSLVDHVIKSALESGIGDVRVVIRQEHEAFFHSEFKEKISMAHQASPRGTGDAVKCALGNMNPSANEFVYLLYADIPLVSKNTLQKLADVAVSCSRTAVVVLAMEAAGSNALGRLEAAETEGTIKSIVESRDASGTTTNRFLPLCNAGLLVRKDMLLNLIEQINPSPVTGEIYATDIVRLAHEAGHLCRYYTADVSELSGANTRGELAALELYFQQKMRQKHLANGVTLVAPETVFFSFDTIIENDVTIKPFVVFGRHVHIKSGSVIESFCSIDGSEVENAVIGPFGRLRQGTQINAGAHIGNFVEIKNSSIGENAKINHLGYIGDSDVGRCCNIGAGVITCNYDGFRKYKTSIGENAFVGSNSALIAPVQVQANAIVAAGSVITHNVESGALAIARCHQKNIPEGAIRFREIKKGKECKKCAE